MGIILLAVMVLQGGGGACPVHCSTAGHALRFPLLQSPGKNSGDVQLYWSRKKAEKEEDPALGMRSKRTFGGREVILGASFGDSWEAGGDSWVSGGAS
jgi:hypothetical protein